MKSFGYCLAAVFVVILYEALLYEVYTETFFATHILTVICAGVSVGVAILHSGYALERKDSRAMLSGFVYVGGFALLTQLDQTIDVSVIDLWLNIWIGFLFALIPIIAPSFSHQPHTAATVVPVDEPFEQVVVSFVDFPALATRFARIQQTADAVKGTISPLTLREWREVEEGMKDLCAVSTHLQQIRPEMHVVAMVSVEPLFTVVEEKLEQLLAKQDEIQLADIRQITNKYERTNSI